MEQVYGLICCNQQMCWSKVEFLKISFFCMLLAMFVNKVKKLQYYLLAYDSPFRVT